MTKNILTLEDVKNYIKYEYYTTCDDNDEGIEVDILAEDYEDCSQDYIEECIEDRTTAFLSWLEHFSIEVKNKMMEAKKKFFENGGIPWNKGTKGVMKAWNKGLKLKR